MRKIIGALALAFLFVGMMPFAAAEDQQKQKIYVDTVNASGDGQQAMPIAEPVREKIQLRVIASERLQEAQQNFVQAKQRYQTAKQSFVQAKQRLNATKSRYTECAGDQSEYCQQVSRETRQNTKQYLLGAADRVISMMEQIKERTRACEQMNEEEAQERIAAIDARIAAIEGSRGTIDDLDNESSSAEIRKAVGEIKQSWTRSSIEMKRSAGKLINAKIGGVVVKSQKLQERLENAIGKLEEEGQDTSELNQLMEQFRERIQNSNMHYAEARKQYQKSGTDEELDSAMREANTHMQQARNELKEVHKTLVQIMKKVRATKGGVQALEEAEAETEDDGTDEEQNLNS